MAGESSYWWSGSQEKEDQSAERTIWSTSPKLASLIHHVGGAVYAFVTFVVDTALAFGLLLYSLFHVAFDTIMIAYSAALHAIVYMTDSVLEAIHYLLFGIFGLD